MINKSVMAFIILIGLLFVSCSRHTQYVCGLSPMLERTAIKSKLISSKTKYIEGTSECFISGIIFGKDSINKKNITIAPLWTASIIFKNTATNDSLITLTDIDGKYEIKLSPGIYNLTIKMLGYVDLQIINLPITSGERKNLEVELGQWGVNSVDCIVNLQETNFDK